MNKPTDDPNEFRALQTVHREDRIERALASAPQLKSAHSRRGYRNDLTRFEEWRAGRPITKRLVESYAVDLQRNNLAPASINRALAAIRWWARYIGDLAYEDRSLGKEQREEITAQAGRVAAVGDVGGERLPKGRHLAQRELMALLAACTHDKTARGNRDAAIIALAWSTGMRRAEIAGLQLADVNVGEGPQTSMPEDVAITIRHGKGDKPRTAWLSGGALRTLYDWRFLRGGQAGPLFCAILKNGKIRPTHGLTTEALAHLLERRRIEAHVKALTWHDFRRTFAGNLLTAAVDLATVQKLMGHQSPITTSNYDRRPQEMQRQAARMIKIPFGGNQ